MRYKNFRIKNFKGIRDIKLDLDKPPRSPVFALVGLNESGKTTILEAIHWLYDSTPYEPHELIPKSELANFNGSISVGAEVGLSVEDEKEIQEQLGKRRSKFILSQPIDTVTIRKSYSFRNSQKVHEEDTWNIMITGKSKQMKEARTLKIDDERWESVKNYIEKNLLPPIIYYENFLFNFPDRIYLEAQPEQKLSRQDRVYSDVIQDVLNSIDRKMRIDSHLVRRHKSGGYGLKFLESVLLKLASKITSETFTIWKELLKIDETGGMEITLGQGLIEDDKGYFLEVKVKEGDQNYLIRERSLGFRWFFAFILFTHFRAFRYARQKKALFLLDEPASNMHPSAQTKLLDVFENFPNKQDVIYATHSHHMINPKWLAGTFVVKNEEKEYTKVDIAYHSHMTRITAERYFQFVAAHPNDTDYFRPILDSLDYQLSKLEFVPELIILEGKNDYYTLKFIRDLGYFDSNIGDHIFPGTGKDKVDYLVGLYIGWGRNFVVLLDDDSGGRRTYNRLKKEYGPVLDGRLYKLGDVNRDWKGYTLENLFLETDYPKVIKTVYPDQQGYDKSKFHIALQDCLLNHRKIKLHTHTIGRFKKLFDFLEEKLEGNQSLLKI